MDPQKRTKVWCGCDVGKQGGIVAIYDDGEIIQNKMPLVSKEIDINKLKDVFCSLFNITEEGKWYEDITIVIEDVHSIFGSGAKSNFSFGKALGILEGVVAALDLPYVKIAPKTWQSVAFLGVPKKYKPGSSAEDKRPKIDNKAMALVAANRLFPGVSFIPQGCRVASDGLIDAALMAYYAKQKFN